MELSDPLTPVSNSNVENSMNRRKSARAKHKPILLQDDITVPVSSNGTGKRKRAELRGGETDNSEDDVSIEESSGEDSDGDPDEEELKEKRKRASRSKRVPTKPATKKPKTTNSRTTKLAVRPAVNGLRKAVKPKKSQAPYHSSVSDDSTGLYGT